MKIVNALLAGILIVLIYIAGRNPEPVVIPPTPTPLPTHTTTRWRYQIERYYDDNLYLASHIDQAVPGFDYVGEFNHLDDQRGQLNITNYGDGSEWEMCGCFLEPRHDGELVVIYKQPAN